MENDKFTTPDQDDWFEKLLNPQEPAKEISADEQAVSSHGMSTLADAELEKIIREALSEDWGMEGSIEAPEPEEAPVVPEPVPEEPEAQLPPEPAPEEDAITAQEEAGEGVPRKVRPKRKGGYGLFGLPHIASTAIWLGLALAIGISLGRLVWVCATDILAFGRQDSTVTITITAGDDLDSITNKLYNAGLIQYPSLFKMYAKLAQVEEKGKISVGTFELNTLYDYHALVGGMSATSSYRQVVKVTIPEGYTSAQIYQLMEENGVCTAAELEAYASESEFSSYWFLEGVERGSKYCLEGFLFPSKYEFYPNDEPRRVFIKLLDAFEASLPDDLDQKLAQLNDRLAEMYRKNGLSSSYIESHRLMLKDVVTVASLIEKEAAYTGEIRNISSVIYNRLTNPSNYPHLNIDATVVYALGGKNDLTAEDLTINHPYNTYVVEGLPPGAIANPGEFSMLAALNPEDTGYYFYALDPTTEIRQHRFFKTYEDHLAFLKSLGEAA